MTISPSIMKRKSGNMLGSGVFKLLNQLIEASLLQALHIVGHLFGGWQLELIKVQLVAAAKGYQTILVVELRVADLVGERLVQA